MTGQVLDFNQAKKQGEPPRGGVDADDIRARLHADPRAFVQWLYSGRALCTKTEARIGNAYGEPGASLSIRLSGPDAGLWHDHATDQGGDLIELYRASMGYTGTANFVLSLKEIAKDFFGDPVEVERSAWQPSALERIEQKKQKLGTKPRADMLELGAPVATYKYYDTRGNVLASVVRFEPDGTRESKTFRPFCFKTIDGVTKWVPGTPDLRPLYHLPEVATATTVVLCEGEGCADALTALGITATSAMQGAKAPIDKTDWSPLAGKKVIIWPDNDPPGFQYAKAASERLLALGCTVLGVTPPADAPAKWDAADCVAEGKDAHALIAGATPVIAVAKPKPRIKLLKLSELDSLQPPAWLIQDVITEHGLSMIWGRSGSLKSFIALDMGLCVATGRDWHGKPVKQGRVIYLAAEGAHGLGGRAIGWVKSKQIDAPKFELIPHGLTLTKDDDLTAMIEAITADPEPIAFIAVDTLSRTFGGGNPNQPSDMNLFVTAADRLKEATQAHVMIIHHGGKDTDKNELGNEGLRNASDTVIHVRRKSETVELINEAPKGKQKDAEEFKPITLRPTKIAYDQNGTEKTTLVMVLHDTQADGEDAQRSEAPRLGKVERDVLKALADAGGDALGLTRLALMTSAHKKSLTRALDNLMDKELVIRADDGDENRKLWKLA
jgi:hypothetical protein